MSNAEKYVPKHRAPGRHKAVKHPRLRAARTSVLLSGIAAAATGVVVSNGVLTSPATLSAVATTAGAPGAGTDTAPGGEQVSRRADTTVVSRSDRRGRTDPAKAAALSAAPGRAVSRDQDLSEADPRAIAKALLPQFGFSASQFSCLDSLYVSESDWRIDADNPTSSAYGIPQALTQLHDLPADYMTSAESQIRWGLQYIRDTYGTPCSAWSFKQGNNWY